MVRNFFTDGEFIEVHVDCPLEECERRDPKGLYKKVRAGLIPQFTGISAPYEPPDQPEIYIRSDLQTVEESVSQVLKALERSSFLVV